MAHPSQSQYPSRGTCSVWRARQRRLWQRGVTALEFAIVSPLAILVIFFAIEMGLSMWADANLEIAAMRISRIGQLGVPENKTCNETVREVLENQLGRWVRDVNSLRADVRTYTPGSPIQLPDIDEEDYAPVCDAGGRGDMVIYRIGFDHPGFSGMMRLFNVQLMRYERTVIIQNEP